jgi:hypothetical protein
VENSKTDILLIRKYLNGELDERAMYQLERRAQDDPELMDLMIGMESGTAAEDELNLQNLHERINERVGKGYSKKLYPYRSWAVAASLFLCASIAAFLFFKQPGQKVSNTGIAKSPQIVRTKPVQIPDTIQKPVAASSGIEPAALATMIASNKTAPIVKAKNSILNPAEAVVSAEQINPSAARARIAVASVIPLSQNDSLYQASGDLAEIVVKSSPVQNKVVITSSSAMISNTNMLPETALQGRVAGVTINSRKAAVSKTMKIGGIVTSADDKTPVAGAMVKLKGSSTGTSTDQNGRFTLEVPGKGETLQVNIIGYEARSVKLGNTLDSNLNVVLSPSTQALAEVVVVRSGKTKKIANKPEPINGWASYKEYLQQRTSRYQQKAKVRLVFSIDDYGQPGNFIVVKSSGKQEIDDYAVQIVQTGPKWTIGANNNHTVKLQLSFR